MISMLYLPVWVFILLRFIAPPKRIYDRKFFQDYLYMLESLMAIMPERHNWISWAVAKWLEKEIISVRQLLDLGLVGMVIFEE